MLMMIENLQPIKEAYYNVSGNWVAAPTTNNIIKRMIKFDDYNFTLTFKHKIENENIKNEINTLMNSMV